ncbi:hypothetical protein PC128_g16785 [Phytophthora cactorum]|nr:hypothetical protein PC120_g13959 [Phytophthora cactorum]KAG3056496.1 hypothetical protein PC121_g15269 [Phytophthora cactorum]KAG3177588.1 hypothetical protein PC128_g16785 [Phytophthora cactorum]KAG4050565.1 hypothetical protein PC123_g14195 [Phytophthora cactorum]
MQSRSKYADQIRIWKRDICEAIDHVQTISNNEKNLLQLNLETHPLPFQPSPVLMQLLQNDRRRRSSGGLRSSAKQQLKSADYLDRKFESEIRQHYEVENAQHCGKWKQFHLRASEARRQLASAIERDFRQFCRHLGASPDEVGHEKDNQQSEISPSPLRDDTISLEDLLRLHLAQDWVQQERFNIQEAFTNQTKKLQDDLNVFLEQLKAEFVDERQRVLCASTQPCLQSEKEQVPRKHHRHKTSLQFQSNAKRGMLLQTAPPLPVESADAEERLMQWRGATAGSRVRSSSRRISNDVDETQDKLDELRRQLQFHQEAAQTKRKDGMQWIGRQCAHLFAQLDCKETEATVVALLLKEEITQIDSLRDRVSEIVNVLEKLCHQWGDKKGDALPQLLSSSEMRSTLKK